MNRQTFLSKFGNPSVVVNTDTTKVGRMMAVSASKIDHYNGTSLCRDVYFYINGGGTTKDTVHILKACFIDLDAGRKDGKYLPMKQVKVKKMEMMRKINQFPVKPSIVVETRNGYQVYWLLYNTTVNNSTRLQWEGLEKKIVGFFKDVGSDPKAIKINQLFRVADTTWWKPWEHQSSHYISVVLDNSKYRYTLENLIQSTQHLSATIKVRNPYSEKWVHPEPVVKDYTPTETVTPKADEKIRIVSEVRDFLNEIQKQLYYSGNKFSASAAKRLVEELSREFCI